MGSSLKQMISTKVHGRTSGSSAKPHGAKGTTAKPVDVPVSPKSTHVGATKKEVKVDVEKEASVKRRKLNEFEHPVLKRLKIAEGTHVMNYLPEYAESGDKFDATLAQCAWYLGKITSAKVMGDDAFQCEVLFDDGEKKSIFSVKKDDSGHEHPSHVLTPWYIVDDSGIPLMLTTAKANAYQLKVTCH